MLVRNEIQNLINGGTIEKKVHEDITYNDIYESEDNLWSFLFFMGYLKMVSMRMENNERYITMSISNIEVKSIYAQEFAEEGYTQVICYGIGFYHKQMKVKVELLEVEEE